MPPVQALALEPVRRGNSSVEIHEQIQTPLGMYAICVGHGTDNGKYRDDVTSPVFPHRRGLDNGLPMLGWAERYNPVSKKDEWYCPPCAAELTPMEDESERL